MRTLPRLAASTIAISVALLLGGCVEPQPNGTPTPNPGATPIFESEEAALAAAEAAYAEYLKVADEIAHEGGSSPQGLENLVTPELLAIQVEDFLAFSATGNRQLGWTSFKTHKLQQIVDLGDGSADLTLYVCVDTSQVRFQDSSGKDVTPTGRETTVPLEVLFQATNQSDTTILVARNEPWSGPSFCS